MLKLRGFGHRVDLDFIVARLFGFRIHEIEFQLTPGLDFQTHSFRAVKLLDQRCAGINWNRVAAMGSRRGETKGNPLFPGTGDRLAGREHVDIRVSIVEIDVRRVPDIAGHIERQQGTRKRVAALADILPMGRGDPFAAHDAVQVSHAQGHCMRPFGQAEIILAHILLSLFPDMRAVFWLDVPSLFLAPRDP